MSYFSWIDGRTLLACQCILLCVFSIMMVGVRSLHPSLRGIVSITTGFMLAIPGTLLFSTLGLLPRSLSLVGAGSCVLLSAIFLYRGIFQFSCDQSSMESAAHGTVSSDAPRSFLGLLCGASALSLLALTYFSRRPDGTGPCVLAITSTLALARGLMAWALYRCSHGRVLVQAFAASMALFAALTGVHAIASVIHPVPTDVLGHGSNQTLSLVLSVIFLCVQGVFYLLMFAGKVTENIHEQARHDYLSGALNRRGIEDALAGEMARIRRSGGAFAVMLIDVDHFKSINDRYGHVVGDAALKRVARSVCNTVRPYDSLGRYGGDEFLMLLPQTGGDDALLTAARVREGLRAGGTEPGAVPLTVSVGITCCSAQEDLTGILARADAALYEAKHAGRDCARLNLKSATTTRGESLAHQDLTRVAPFAG